MGKRARRNLPVSLLCTFGAIGVIVPLLMFPMDRPTTDVEDAIRGVCVGVCLGVQILGAIWIYKAKARRAG